MPDYSACANSKCPLRGDCARYRMIWGDHQTVAAFKPRGGKCLDQIPADKAPFRIHTLKKADQFLGRFRK